ncbi:MAG: ATP-binding cassette domain-containing protein [Verrucomicrobiae bacterium]|nr:ATP-binding cassette domain-containing protein [Verrucomicrobiae bacterium]
MDETPHIEVKDLVCAYGDYRVLEDISFQVKRSEILVVMGRSGCGKSTLLKHMIGLREPASGQILYSGKDFASSSEEERETLLKKFGVLYQGGALWSSMTLEENVAFPLEEYTNLKRSQIREIVDLKLSQVGLKGFQEFYPSELSGGMRKRAGLARAMALDPEILFFDEPSSGLDPVSSKRLDDLILSVRDLFGTTVVVVTHELDSIFTIADQAIMLSPTKKTIIAQGDPKALLRESADESVTEFLSRKGGRISL